MMDLASSDTFRMFSVSNSFATLIVLTKNGCGLFAKRPNIEVGADEQRALRLSTGPVPVQANGMPKARAIFDRSKSLRGKTI
jgi:hypothetical protein